MITVSGGMGTVLDAKTGEPSTSHKVQVMLYMYALPKALPQYRGITLEGKVVYPDHEESIPDTAIFFSSIWQVNRIYGKLNPYEGYGGEWLGTIRLLSIKYQYLFNIWRKPWIKA